MNLHDSIWDDADLFFVPACTEKGVWGYAPTSKVQRTFVTGYPVALLAAL